MMRKMITTGEAEILLEKYYDGFTSAEEEKLLHIFLLKKELPERFEADKAILNYFDSQRKENQEITVFHPASPTTKKRFIPLFRWTSIAASVIIGIMTVYFIIPIKSESYAYVDGKKITNMEQIKEQALASIQSWNDSESSPNLDADELINQQFQLFTK
jgi:hypothetical protein